MLIRIALVNHTPSTTTVLRSLFASSSLCRSVLQSEAAEFRIATLNALGLASNRETCAMQTNYGRNIRISEDSSVDSLGF
ncbi:Fungal transcriptional regulatory protein, N-terminal [Penicillium digitatum]|uniref:Fungal transcriptional regulatory protein, N-terminal n=1 Tax=Penicillium digitatum TaxID=36651 RepID=A0A7T7BHU3_PENDI|nr:Fungal transcriptional regulatory protein, N-terminal [Penicillium digitatum]